MRRWEGGDKEQSSVVSATDNEHSVWLAVILLVWIRRPRFNSRFLGLSPAALLFSSQHVLYVYWATGSVLRDGFQQGDRGLCTDGLLTNWLKSEDLDRVSQPGV